MPEQPTDALSGNGFGRGAPNATAEMIELLLADDRCWHELDELITTGYVSRPCA